MGKRYKARPMSRLDIRKMADNFRKILGLENALYVDVLRLLEMILPSMGLEHEIVPSDEMDQEAVTFPDENKIYIREDVYYGAMSGVGRYRFTIMHEIAHSILHGKSAISLARGEDYVPLYMDPEWQANAFAGEFLMPEKLVSGIDAFQVSEACGVSLAAAEYQLRKIKRQD